MFIARTGHRFWQKQLNGSSSVLGTVVATETGTYRVIGVLSEPSSSEPFPLTDGPVFVPKAIPRTNTTQVSPFALMARVRPGVTPAQLAVEVQRVAAAPDWQPVMTPLLDRYVGTVGQWMLLALGAAALVVLIACVNVANLMLTRSSNRAHELAIRSSLGASRRRVAFTVLIEGWQIGRAHV